MSEIVKINYFQSPYGELILGEFEEKLCLCDWRYRKMRNSIDNRIKAGLKADYVEQTSSIIVETQMQLNEYFKGKRKKFDIPLLLVGTDFQKSVWHALMQISWGDTETYLGLSRQLENEKAIRAVASANGANAISIIIPCHRIIGSDGSLVGYAGGLATKSKLLKLENAIKTTQLDLFEG